MSSLLLHRSPASLRHMSQRPLHPSLPRKSVRDFVAAVDADDAGEGVDLGLVERFEKEHGEDLLVFLVGVGAVL
jgi:hypothetical protein